MASYKLSEKKTKWIIIVGDEQTQEEAKNHPSPFNRNKVHIKLQHSKQRQCYVRTVEDRNHRGNVPQLIHVENSDKQVLTQRFLHVNPSFRYITKEEVQTTIANAISRLCSKDVKPNDAIIVRVMEPCCNAHRRRDHLYMCVEFVSLDIFICNEKIADNF